MTISTDIMNHCQSISLFIFWGWGIRDEKDVNVLSRIRQGVGLGNINITSQMTQGTRRPNQMEFKARPNIAGECLDIFQYKIEWSNIKKY